MVAPRIAAVADPELRALWEHHAGTVIAGLRSAEEARLGITYLWNFVIACNRCGGGGRVPEDVRSLNATREGTAVALAAWESLVQRSGMVGRYRLRVQRRLGSVLALVVPGLSFVVNPVQRPGRASAMLTAARSAVRSFDLHECLPLEVRRGGVNQPRYRLLMRLGEALAAELRSVSKGNLQKSLLLLDQVLCRGSDPLQAAEDPLRAVRHLDANGWLDRYEAAVALDAHATTVSVEYFRRQMRTLDTMLRALHPRGRGQHDELPSGMRPMALPVPRGGHAQQQQRTAARCVESSSSSTDSSSFGSCGTTDLDERARTAQQSLRARVRGLMERRCGHRSAAAAAGGDDDEDRAFAFSAAEVRSILQASCSTLERLVVLLFLTTGLRIAGLSRLRVGPQRHTVAALVPSTMRTVEKNGKARAVFLTPACRILVARWERETMHLRSDDRAASSSPFLFTSTARHSDGGGARVPQPVSTSYLWKTCRVVFQRAGIAGPHVHPHTFRHTLVHLMYMGGTSFERIAKFIGHANASITSKVYGRLQHADMLSAVQGVPFLQDADSAERRQEWLAVGRLMRDPWPTAPEEWSGLERPSAAEAHHHLHRTGTEDRKRRLKAESLLAAAKHRRRHCHHHHEGPPEEEEEGVAVPRAL